MCISLRPAKFSKTKILTMQLENGNHFTAYQNNATNLVNEPNCMVLPIPGRTKPEYFVDTTLYNKFLDDIVANSEQLSLSRGVKFLTKGGSFQSFQKGQYTIGLCESFDSMKAFLASLPEEKRPSITDNLLKFFESHYHNWSFALCVFGADVRVDSQPIAYEYAPFRSDLLFYPTMDSHDGDAPSRERVVRDHSFIKSIGRENGKSEYFTQNVPEYLKENKYVFEDDDNLSQNGDHYFQNNTKTNIEYDLVFENIITKNKETFLLEGK